MVFQSFARYFGEFFDRRRAARATRRKPKADLSSKRRPLIEVLEDRLAPATLSAPIVQNAYAFLHPTDTGVNSLYNPQLAVDPLNPNNMVLVTRETATPRPFINPSADASFRMEVSNDGGTSWSAFNITATVTDPESLPLPVPFAYQVFDSPSVTFDRLGNVYVAGAEHDPNQDSGAITLSKFSFQDLSDGFYIPLVDENVIHRWYRGPAAGAASNVSDSAYDPVVAIDNNLPSYTDPTTGLVQTDSLATLIDDPNNPGQQVPKAVFVAWSSREVDTSSVNTFRNGPIGLIKMAVSGDGGVNFSTRENVSSGNDTVFNSVQPQFFFTQGTPYDATDPTSTPRIQGGLLGVVWNDFPTGDIEADLSAPDQGNATQAAAVVQSFPTNGVPVSGTILDAGYSPTQKGQPPSPNIPQTTTFEMPVDITDPNFDYLTDLEVSIDIIHPHMDQVSIALVAPDGTSIDLLRNRTAADGTTIVTGLGTLQGVANLPNMGTVNGASLDTVFNQKAFRTINSQVGTFQPTAPYVGYFRPEAGSLAQFNGRTATQLNGTWKLQVTDYRFDGVNPGPVQSLEGWKLNFTARVADRGKGSSPSTFGTDNFVGAARTTIAGGFTTPYPTSGGVYGTQGLTGGVVVAVDNSLGSFSPYQGRVYIAYTGSDTNIYLSASDDFAPNSSAFSPLSFNPVNDDSVLDNYSQGNRPQFMPSIAVDQVTGTLAISWYDGRNDPALARVANYLTTSTDGGDTYSPQISINIPSQAKDALTGQEIDLEPTPGNQGLAGTYGFGVRQALYAYNGRILPFYTSNLNTNGRGIFTADIYAGAGPRIVVGDQGPVVNDFTAGTGLFYNNTFGPDGKRQLDGFVVTFDRPIDPSTFGPSDVAVKFQDPNTQAGNLVDVSNQVLSVTPLDVSASHGPNDPGTPPTVVLNDAIITEGNSGQKLATLTVTMSQVQTTPITVNYTTADGTALAGSDYITSTGKLTIPAGSTSATFTVPIIGDTFKEGNEFFWIGLYNIPAGITVTKPLGRVTILDDEDSPTVVVGDGIAKEGDSGVTQMIFPVVLSGPSAVPIVLTYGTSDLTATAGSDYSATTSSITIPAGITTAQISVPVLGDQKREGNEAFQLNLVGKFSRSEQQTLILSNSGNLNANVTLGFLGETATTPLFVGTLPTAATVQANLETIASLTGNITVTSPVPGTYVITFNNAASTGAFAGLDVPPITVVSTATGGTATVTETLKGGNTDTVAIVRPIAMGVIVDDDNLAVSVGDVSVREGTDPSAAVTFYLNGKTSNDVTVNFSLNTTGLIGPTATLGTDYTNPGSFNVIIPAGSTSATVNIPIVNDATVENIERFNVVINTTTNAAVLDGTGTVTIVDDDTAAAQIFLGDAVVREGDSGTSNATVTIYLSEPLNADVTGLFSTVNGGSAVGGAAAGPGIDYVRQTNVPFTITAGTTSTTVTIPIVGDLNVENDETVNMTITSVNGGANTIDVSAARAKTTGTVTIVDDDVHIYLADAMGQEGNGPGTFVTGNIQFKAFLDSPKSVPITFQVSTAAGTATDTSANSPPNAGDIDFATILNQTITIPAGSTSVNINVGILGDTVVEGNEFFSLSINAATLTVGGIATNAASGMITRGTANGTIVDDDGNIDITLSNPTMLEGNTGTTQMQFDIYVSQPQANDIFLQYFTEDGTAVGDVVAHPTDDYDYGVGGTAPPATNLFRIPANTTRTSIFIPIQGDVNIEPNEQFRVVFQDPSAGAFTQNILTGDYGFATGTILNDDRLHTVFPNAIGYEGNTVDFNGIASQPITGRRVGATFASGTATSSVDYAPLNDTGLTVVGNITLNTNAFDDDFTENVETLTATFTGGTIAVSGANGSATAPVTATGRIIDADRLAIVAGDASFQEVPGGSLVAQIPVYLTGTPNPGQVVTVDYSFNSGTAQQGVDFSGATGTLTFDPSAALPIDRVRQFITVTILSDNVAAGNKDFTIDFSNPVNAGLPLRTETQTLSITNANNITFTYNGQQATASNVFSLTAANIQTALTSLVPGITVTALPNTGTTQNFLINFNNSSDVANVTVFKAFFLDPITRMSTNGTATVTETQKGGTYPTTITIIDASQLPTLTIGNAVALEGNSGSTPANFTVIASYPLPVGTNITAQISTADGTAKAASSDYTAAVNQPITIIGGTTTATFAAQVLGDTLPEGEETFTASIVSSTNSTVLSGTGTGIIVDDDKAPNISLSDVSVQEGDYSDPNNVRYAVVTATLNKAVNYDVTFTLSTANGNAASGNALGNLDYVPNSIPVKILAGQLTATFKVQILPDTIKEGDETFLVNMTNVAGASVYKGQSLITIQDDDGELGATQFLVRMTPQNKVGSYTYSVGPNVGDRIRTSLPTADAFENGTSGVYTPNAVNQNVPIGGPNSTISQISVSGLDGSQVLRDLTVTVNITHPDPANYLNIELISPSGQVVELFDSSEFPFGITGGNLLNTTFDERSANRQADSLPPFVGSIQPPLFSSVQIGTTDLAGNFVTAVPIHMLYGQSPNGTWTLRVTDSSGQFNAGVLKNWSLNIDTGALLANGQLGNAMDQNQSGFSNDKNRGGDAYANPNPTNGRPFQLPYDDTTAPLTIPGPHQTGNSFHYVSQESVRIPTNLYGGTGTSDDKSTSVITVNNIPAGQLISDINVTMAFNHNSPSDLTFTLVSPTGTRVILAKNGLDGSGFFISSPVTFDDQAGSFSPVTYTIPYSALSVLNGFDPNGAWTLEIQDNTFPTSGTLLQWALDISTERVAVNSTISSINVTFDRNINVATFVPGNILRMTGPIGAIVPTPAQPFIVTPVSPQNATVVVGGVSMAGTVARTFNIQFPTQQVLSGTYSIVYGPDASNLNPNTNYIADSLGNKVDNNYNAGVSVMRGADPTNALIAPVSATSAPGTANNIVGNATTDFTIDVNQAFLIKYLTLTLDIAINDVSTLDAKLISPSGTIVQLFTQPGQFATNSRANMQNVTFDDAAVTPIQLGNPPYTSGTFNPQKPLSAVLDESSKGTWTLEITNAGSSGTLTGWTLNFKQSVPGTGLGEAGADQFQQHFRVFVEDPTNSVTQKAFTPVGPTAQNLTNTGGVAPIPAVAIDPGDPSGNTAYVGTSNGGVWKTSNFLTNDPLGPSYVPLLDFAPTSAASSHGLTVGSIAVYGRNRDPNQSIVFVGTGGSGGNGVGVMRSLDGGKTWNVLDSAVNADGLGKVLALSDPLRDHRFVNTTIGTVVVDPNAGPGGKVIVYIAVQGGANAGLYRSTDSGDTWTLVRAGTPTDIVLAAGSKGPTGNLSKLYAGFGNEGVFFTDSATTSLNLTRLDGNQGVNYRVRNAGGILVPVTVVNPPETPTTNAGSSIKLATPALTGNPLLDTIYQGYIYALSNDVLYVSKDFGNNWTHARISTLIAPNGVYLYGTNNDEYVAPNFAAGTYGVGDYPNLNAITIDPQNPNIIYLMYTGRGINPVSNVIRVDITKMQDPYMLVEGNNHLYDGGATLTASQGSAVGILSNPPLVLGTYSSYGIYDPNDPFNPKHPYTNALRDPDEPFLQPTNQLLINMFRFNNDGKGVKWTDYWSSIDSTVIGPFDQYVAAGTPFLPSMVTSIDPDTGLTRVVMAGLYGVYTALDDGSGNRFTGSGKSVEPAVGNRIGNIAAGILYDGASQPSILSADIAQALFYGTSYNGTFDSSNSFLGTGNLAWSKSNGVGRQTQTDPSGSGIAYQYIFPSDTAAVNPNNLPGDFFQIANPGTLPIGRVSGLIQAGDNPAIGAGQWPNSAAPMQYSNASTIANLTGKFATNPVDPTALVIGSRFGNVFRSNTASTGRGIQWFQIAAASDLDGSYAGALAFGSPNSTTATVLSDFIYAGTTRGNVYVTTTGGGTGGWTQISNGLDGSAVLTIVPNPKAGAKDVFAITTRGVYYLADSSNAASSWVKLNDTAGQDTFFGASGKTRTVFGTAETTVAATFFTDLAVDWRYAIPNAAGGGTHPVLYVSTDGGIFRSTDMGVNWKLFPLQTMGAFVDGGYLPNVVVSDIDLVLGDTTPTTGVVNESTGFNMLYATTFGRSAYSIRLNNSDVEQFRTVPSFGPKVVTPGGISAYNPNPQTTLQGINVTFDNSVDPATFTTADVTLTGPGGVVITVTGIQKISSTQYRIVFAPQSANGSYTVKIGPNLSDYAGNLMNQDGDNINGEPNDFFQGTIAFSANTPPTISPIADQAVPPGGVGGTTINFTIGDAQDPPSALTVVASSSNTLFVPNSGLVLGGSGANRTITITPVGNTFGVTVITLTVTDVPGLSKTITFSFAVDNAPSLSAIQDQVLLASTIPNPNSKSIDLAPLASDPDSGQNLTFLAPVTAAVSTPAYIQDQTIGLTADASGTFYPDLYGAGNKWLIYNPTGEYFVIQSNGELHRYSPSGNHIGPLVIDGLDPSYNADPHKLYGLINPYSTFVFNQYGFSEKWMFNPATQVWYAVLPNGELHTYGSPSSPIGALVGTFTTGTSPSEYWQHPVLLTEPPPPANPPAGAVTVSGSILTIAPPPNFVGSFTVQVTVSDGFLTASRSFTVSVYNQGPTLNPVADQIVQHSSSGSLTTFNVPLSATDPDGQTLSYSTATAPVTTTAYSVDTGIGLIPEGNGTYYYPNLYGYNEKWLVNAVTGMWFAILPNGELHRYGSSAQQIGKLVADMGVDYYYNPELLIGLTEFGSYSQNKFGANEKWMFNPGNQDWYAILPNGELHKFSGNMSAPFGTLIATFPTEYWNNPTLVHEPPPPANPPASAFSFVGNTLAITPPANFIGSFSVTLTASDGIASSTQTFNVTVYDIRPTYDVVGEQIVDHSNAVSIPLNAADDDSNDTVTFSVATAAATTPAFDLDHQYGFVQKSFDYDFNKLGLNEKWLYGANTGHWYALIPDPSNANQMQIYDGGTTQNSVSVFPIADSTLPIAYYNTPSLLHEPYLPANPPSGTVSVSGGALNIAPAPGFIGTFQVTLTGTDGMKPLVRSFFVTITDNAPSVDPIGDVVMSSTGTTQITVGGSDPDVTDSLSFSLLSPAVALQAYNLDNNLNLIQEAGTYYGNLDGQNEKWMVSASSGTYYAILPNGELHQYGSPAAPIGTLLATLPQSFYSNPALLHEAATPGVAPPPTSGSAIPAISLVGNTLTINPNGFVGRFQIMVLVSDGITVGFEQFIVTTT